MQTTKAELNETMIQLLSRFIGTQLVYFECDKLNRNNATYMKIGIFFDEGAFEIHNEIEVLDVGGKEEFGVLSIIDLSNKRFELEIEPNEPVKYSIDKNVKDIKIVTDTVSCFEDEIEQYTAHFDVAIVFEFEDEELVIEKDVWFSEHLIVRQGRDMIKKMNAIDKGWDFHEHERGVFRRSIQSVQTSGGG